MPNNYGLIFETTSIVNSSQLNIIEETTVNGKPKIAFHVSLQESDVLNENRRRYPKAICESIVERLTPKVQNRSCLLEIDHPMNLNVAIRSNSNMKNLRIQ